MAHFEKALFLNTDIKTAGFLEELKILLPGLEIVRLEAKALSMRKHEVTWWLATHSCKSFVIVDMERRYGAYDPRLVLVSKWGWSTSIQAEVLRLFDEDSRRVKWG